MILIAESGCAVVKSQGHLGNAGLIGALIVPSKDIVRFALIASGSDKSYESFFESATSGTDLAGRSTDVANKIITELIQAELMKTLDPAPRKQAIAIVEGEVRKEREITLLEQVGARGALDTLKATATDMEGWVYKYGKRDKFNEDLKYLRSEGLISFAYDDLDTITITLLGRAVLGRATAGPGRIRIQAAAIRPASGGLVPRLSVIAPQHEYIARFEECPPDITRVTDVSKELLSPDGRSMKLEVDFKYMRFVVSEASNYRIDVKVKAGERKNTDPQLVLFHLTNDDGCTRFGVDDDGGGDLNSRLSVRLEPGTYSIGTRTLNYEGAVTVSVKKSDG